MATNKALVAMTVTVEFNYDRGSLTSEQVSRWGEDTAMLMRDQVLEAHNQGDLLEAKSLVCKYRVDSTVRGID